MIITSGASHKLHPEIESAIAYVANREETGIPKGNLLHLGQESQEYIGIDANVFMYKRIPKKLLDFVREDRLGEDADLASVLAGGIQLGRQSAEETEEPSFEDRLRLLEVFFPEQLASLRSQINSGKRMLLFDTALISGKKMEMQEKFLVGLGAKPENLVFFNMFANEDLFKGEGAYQEPADRHVRGSEYQTKSGSLIIVGVKVAPPDKAGLAMSDKETLTDEHKKIRDKIEWMLYENPHYIVFMEYNSDELIGRNHDYWAMLRHYYDLDATENMNDLQKAYICHKQSYEAIFGPPSGK